MSELLALTKEDYSNLRVFLDRVGVNGVTEARVLAVLAAKLDNQVANYDVCMHVQDAPFDLTDEEFV